MERTILARLAQTFVRSERLHQLFALILVMGLALAAILSSSLVPLTASAYTTTATGTIQVTALAAVTNPSITWSVSPSSGPWLWGNTVDIQLTITNTGGPADFQTLHISFPSISCNTDTACGSSSCTSLYTAPCVQVTSCSAYSNGQPNCKVYPAGTTFPSSYGSGTVTSSYLVVEGSQVPMNTGQSVSMTVRVAPNLVGSFLFQTKTFAKNGAGSAYQPNSGGTGQVLDQQNEYVYLRQIPVSLSMSFQPFSLTLSPGGTATATVNVINSNPGTITITSFSVVSLGGCPCYVSATPALAVTIPGGTSKTITIGFTANTGAAAGTYVVTYTLSGSP